jgi:hypothetical protein
MPAGGMDRERKYTAKTYAGLDIPLDIGWVYVEAEATRVKQDL